MTEFRKLISSPIIRAIPEDFMSEQKIVAIKSKCPVSVDSFQVAQMKTMNVG